MSDEVSQKLERETSRERELAEGYAAWAEDFQTNSDPLTEIGLNDNLEPSNARAEPVLTTRPLEPLVHVRHKPNSG
jgi:hypothetical protein